MVKVSLRPATVPNNLAANRRFAALGNRVSAPLGSPRDGKLLSGRVKSAMGIGILLAEGIGDTIRVSLVGEPEEEVRVASRSSRREETDPAAPNLIDCQQFMRTVE